MIHRMGWSLSLPFLTYGDRFRRQRRLIQRYFDAQAAMMFRPVQTERVHLFINELLHQLDRFRDATQRYALLFFYYRIVHR